MAQQDFKCNNCGHTFSASRFADHCPKCNSFDISRKTASRKKPLLFLLIIAGIALLGLLLWWLFSGSGSEVTVTKKLTISRVFQEENFLSIEWESGQTEDGEFPDVIKMITINNTSQRLDFEGVEIYPCEIHQGRLALKFTSGDSSLFRDTIINVSFYLEDRKPHKNALCERSVEPADPDGAGKNMCPEPADIQLKYNKEECAFSVGLKKPFDELDYTVLVDGKTVEPGVEMNLRALDNWNISVQINSGACSGGQLDYYGNGDRVNTAICPKEYSQKEVDELKGLLTKWLNEPGNRVYMDQCQQRIKTVFGDKDYAINLDGEILDTYAALREKIDNETLNDPSASYRLIGFDVNKTPYRLKEIKIVKQ